MPQDDLEILDQMRVNKKPLNQKLKHNDIKEVKVDVRSFNRDLQDTKTIAVSAEKEAKRANNRIDHLLKENKEKNNT